MAPPAVRKWVIQCRKKNPSIKRGDLAPFDLELPEVLEDSLRCTECGVYELDERWQPTLVTRVEKEISMFFKPRLGHEKPAPTVKHLDEAWEMLQFRESAAAAPFGLPPRPLRRDVEYLAQKRVGVSQKFLEKSGKTYPLSPLLAAFVERGCGRGVGREAEARVYD